MNSTVLQCTHLFPRCISVCHDLFDKVSPGMSVAESLAALHGPVPTVVVEMFLPVVWFEGNHRLRCPCLLQKIMLWGSCQLVYSPAKVFPE